MSASTDLVTSKLTTRSQTTLPPAVRKVLGLKAGHRIGYEITGRTVRLVNIETQGHEDPNLEAFLDLLSESIATSGVVHPISAEVLMRAVAASGSGPIDHDASIHGHVAI